MRNVEGNLTRQLLAEARGGGFNRLRAFRPASLTLQHCNTVILFFLFGLSFVGYMIVVFTCCLLFAAKSGMSDKSDKLGKLDKSTTLDKVDQLVKLDKS